MTNMPCHLLVVLALVASLAGAQEIADSRLQFSNSRPSCAMFLPGDLCGFSIEPDRFPDWAGNVTHKNNFTYTLMNTLKQKTGAAPRVRSVLLALPLFRSRDISLINMHRTSRVGGGTQDHIIYDANITGEPGFSDIFAAVPAVVTDTKQLFPEASYVFAGYDYWLSSCNFPEGTQFTWGVNFGAGNSSEAVAQVREIEKAFSVSLFSNRHEYELSITHWI